MKASKKTIAVLLAAITMMTGVALLPTETDAAGETLAIQSTIEYVETDYATYEAAWGVQEKVPTKEGYLFGGWYADADGATVIRTKSQVAENESVYAKFVPAQVLSVKAQIHSTTVDTDETTDVTDTRMVSSIDSRAYTNVGFEIIDMESDRLITDSSFDTVYSTLEVKEGEETTAYTPEQIFGTISNAKQHRFIVLTVQNIPEIKWNSDIYVRPYWTTYDGVKVHGLGKYVYVRDGLDGWVSIPVNLHTGAQVAAGMVSVSVPTSDDYTLVYQECRGGRVFEDMTAAMSGNKIRCVGNMSGGTNVSANDLFAVFRFKVEGNYKVGSGTFLNFTVNDLGFANTEEAFVDMNIMNVQY